MRPFSSLIAVWLLVLAAPVPVHSYGHTDKVPAFELELAYFFYRGPGTSPSPVLAENTLRLFVLGESKSYVGKNRKWLAQSDWQGDFKDLFDRAIRWVREIRAKEPENVYRLSHELQKRPDADENNFDSLSYRLLQIAAKMGHLNAIAELTQRVHPVDEPGVRAEMARTAYDYATREKGRYPDRFIADGQTNLAYSYWKGLGVEKDLMKALYWYLRGHEKGKDVSWAVFPISNMLSTSQMTQVKEWLDSGTVPKF